MSALGCALMDMKLQFILRNQRQNRVASRSWDMRQGLVLMLALPLPLLLPLSLVLPLLLTTASVIWA